MISSNDISLCIIISLVYLLVLPFQLLIFPMNYYSVKEVIYSKSFKKASVALAARFIFIFGVCLFYWLAIAKDKGNICIYGISIGSFLCTWPSIYHYQLFRFWKGKSRFLYFCSCLVSIIFSYISAKLSMTVFIPLLFEGKSSFFIDNNAFSFLISLLGFCSPFGIKKLLDKEGAENPYIDSDTYMADLCLTKRKIQFERYFEEEYRYEIQEAAQKYEIGKELLTTVLQLERINRGSMHCECLENISVKLIGDILIKKNATLGIAQVSIKEAQNYFQKAPKRFLLEMLKPEVSIDLCAFIIRQLINRFLKVCDQEYYKDYEDLYNELTENMKISLYIATEYTCGKDLSLRKFIMVYATIISETNPYHYISTENENG